ncbi:MAG: hypothetical protein ACOC97_05990 [Myxococcota bacterium]
MVPCGVGTCATDEKCCVHCEGNFYACVDPEGPCPTPPIVCPEA